MAETPNPPGYDEALAFLYGRINYERLGDAGRRRWRLKLGRMRRLLSRLGDPHEDLPCVHIAGTKGKGSTAGMISSVLVQSGYTTGLYTSPHLERLEQRLQVNGQPCSAEELTQLVDAVRPEVSAMDCEAGDDEAGKPTFFEITTAMAFLHFRRRNVQLAVMEVGMGGRLDSTNVCQPVVSVITSISFDHTQQLGKTLSAIAGEKAGILKRAVPLVCGVRAEEPRRVIEEAAERNDCPMRQLGVDFAAAYHGPAHAAASNPAELVGGMSYRRLDRERDATTIVRSGTRRSSERPLGFGSLATSATACVSFESPASSVTACESRRLDDGHEDLRGGVWRDLPKLHLPLWGRHQARNAAVAIEALQILRQRGWTIRETDLRRGLTATRCPARAEVVAHRPTILLDVAHNVASIDALLATIDEYCPDSHRVLLFASSKDKDLRGMVKSLAAGFDRILLTRIRSSPRSAPLDKLREAVEACSGASGEASPQASYHDDPHEALQTAIQATPHEGLLCITGSFFIAAELRQELLARQPVVTYSCVVGTSNTSAATR
jgi:dihydrofolate synthase/folylpolyglutamate synthase